MRLLEGKYKQEAPDRLLPERDLSATYCLWSRSYPLQVLTCDWQACSEFINFNNCKKFLTWSLSNVLSAKQKAQWRNKCKPHHHQWVGSYSLAKTYLAAMLARNARSMGRSQEAQELSSSSTPGTEPQVFGPRSLVPFVRSSSASSPLQWNKYTTMHYITT